MTLESLLREASDLPLLEARLLLMQAVAQPRAWLLAHPEALVEEAQALAFRRLCARRRAGEPIAYILGRREFYGLEFECTPAALIPRPETELLVDLARQRVASEQPSEVLELGTGTGAIALALAWHCPQANITASDLSDAALALARANAARLALSRVRFVSSNWYDDLPKAAWDLIVSNPPYIAPDDPHLGQGDLRFEPRQALTPEGDGLDALRLIIAGAPQRLAAGGSLLVEHGWDQGEAVRALFTQAGFRDLATERDLAGQERVTLGRKGLAKAVTD